MTKAPRPERRHYFLEERHHLTKEQQAVVAKIFTGAVARCQLSMIGARSSEERAFYVSHTAEAEQLAEIFKAREAVNIEDDDQEELVDENRDCHPTRQ